MIVREVLEEEKSLFNQAVGHPLQSWEWGEFRKKTGVGVVRIGVFDGQKLLSGYQLTVHKVPKLPYSLIYFPKGPAPDVETLTTLRKIAKQNGSIFVKLEPNVGDYYPRSEKTNATVRNFLLANGCKEGRPLFTRFTFQLDLTRSEDQLLAAMKPKTRYNVRLSQRYGVEIVEDNSLSAFEAYLDLMMETTKRQGFYAHTSDYHRKLWETLVPTGMYHLFLAKYKKKVLAAYVFFIFKNVLYYPYGASTRDSKEVMPTYSLFWEAIRFGQKMGCVTFDMWGTPGPNPDPKDAWFGFHRFKEGFGSRLYEFVGSYDLVIEPQLYRAYGLVNNIRWKLLRAWSALR